MLNDYGALLAWKFGNPVQDGDDVALTTMVRLPV
jgi:hypothetical protein